MIGAEPSRPEIGVPDAVEWVVVLARFDQDHLLDRLAERGDLDTQLVVRLGEEIARFHDSAEVIGGPTGQGVENFAWAVEETMEELLDAHDLFSVINLPRLADAARSELAALRPLLARRAAEGRVRRCHGDLHLGNIVVIDGEPRLFDCIEFNDKISCIDVLYDLAFLLMDLEHRAKRAEANCLLNRYLEENGDLGGLAALPLF